MEIRGRTVHFKPDTGAEVTAISQESFQRVGQVSMKKSVKVVYGPAKQKLDVIGQLEKVISYVKKLIKADNIRDSWSQS